MAVLIDPIVAKSASAAGEQLIVDRRSADLVPTLSFIIPAKNERHHIARCIASVRQWTPVGLCYEVLVIDNGSTDGTIDAALDAGVDVVAAHRGRIGRGRNLGASLARGNVLAFIDADVALTQEWSAGIQTEVARLEGTSPEISGSWYQIAPQATWVERAWFEPLAYGEKTHMNGGHLLIGRATFQLVGGFSEGLATGEDYEFCARAKRMGIGTVNQESLVVIHHGYPKTLTAFFFREVWHGLGDFHSLSTFLKSPTAVGSVVVVCLFFVALASAVTLRQPSLAFAAIAVLTAASFVLGLRTFGFQPLTLLPQRLVLGAAYIFARALPRAPSVQNLAQRFRRSRAT